jgi:phosphoserine phosphatase RsbU/P
MTENMQRLLAIEKERERLQAELEIAREVQNQLYPKKVPAMESLCVTAVCNPARMVSGDYYDYQQLGSDKVAIAIGDVAGKGISAALLMATVQSSFRSQIRGSLEVAVSATDSGARIQISTSSLVSQLNQQLYADTSPEKYATFYLGVYDQLGSILTYTNAGHLPPLLVRRGEAERLEVNGMVVGAFPFARYGESQVRLEAGDLIVFFTDGITEPENAYGEMFGEERLTEIVVRNADRSDREIIDSVMEAVQQWTGAGELQDDMTLLLVRRR